MTGAGGLDLTGRWKGIFNYPRLLPPIEFDAELRDLAGAVSGVTTEPHIDSGAVIHATLEGSREGARVRFRKIYDDIDDDYRTVSYDGHIDPSGDEISGQWTVPGVWSGTFLMVRAAGREETVERKVEAQV